MKVFASGIMTETNTFSPFPTGMADYVITHASEFIPGEQTHDYGNAIDIWYRECQKHGWEFSMGLCAYAQPAGITPRPVYEALRDEMLNDLKQALPVDVVLLTLHGSMVADGYDDCETDMIDKVRRLVGPDVKIGVELDLHCDLTDRMIAQADAIVIFKEYPHTDIADRAVDLFDIIADAAAGRINPVMAVFDCRMLGLYITSHPPMRCFVDEMMSREGKAGLLSLSLAHTFPWADVPHAGVKMLAITDNDLSLAKQVAEEFGRKFFNLRHALQMDCLAMPAAIDKALGNPAGPVVVADIADNAGGGAPGDSTFVLQELLRQGIDKVALGMIWDPIVVQIAHAAGEGAGLNVRLGGKMGPMSGDPLDLQVTVAGLAPNMVQELGQGKSDPVKIQVGDAVCLHCQGVDIVVNSLRTQLLDPAVFSKLGVDIANKQLVVVKSTQHFHAGFSPFASEILYMAAPGAIAPHFTEIPYQRIDRKKFPWIDDPFENPGGKHH